MYKNIKTSIMYKYITLDLISVIAKVFTKTLNDIKLPFSRKKKGKCNVTLTHNLYSSSNMLNTLNINSNIWIKQLEAACSPLTE